MIFGFGWMIGGVGIGMSLADVERVNGRPFKLLDFEGDAGGLVPDWMGGKLATLPGGCRLGAGFGINLVALSTAQWNADSEGTVSSDDAALRAAEPKLGELTVYFPDNSK